ncbi:MAG TPA: RimK family alpha-L-glutamate ligase [Haliscomenobacter sp.]|uniref:RimK family alpha-L-glutamate ligase n=1 Tax=Haliscomenobacter sp. TaxID=2717303 RepID=UPI001D2B4FF6|nr:RimK family alpha-L-glutamate ligase [Haliscomenobacter sp.]MBK9491753.1 RimK family alpha-L-glutamate ligase [Haliscomenobacter sp.]HOY20219.1 RimK family alpha-L-glutamate ligase [Haliscomenobacter sp.]HPH17942.1 RimK family alpha-L-glutamate ligase [Haliscomenobacter sp.]
MKIGILSTSQEVYSTQSLQRCGLARGHQIELIDYKQCSLIMEQGRAEMYYKDFPLSHLDAVIPRISTNFTLMGAAVLTQLRLMKVFSTVRPEALLLVRDKLRCLQRLQEIELDVPQTAYVGEGQPIGPLISMVGGLPVVIKLLESTHGLGVILSESYRNAESTIEAFHRLNERVIMQEFIREARGADIRAFVVNGKVIASMKRQARDGEFRSNLHRGASAEQERLTPQEDHVARTAAKAVGLDVAGVDILRSERGPLIMEVNASPGLEGIENTTQIDVAGKIFDFVEKKVLALKNGSLKKKLVV